jgi:hypothetical protein
MSIRQVTRVALLLTFLLSWAGISWAQTSTGTISGTARDSSGGVLPGIQVVILNVDTGISRTLQTDDGGHYSAVSLSLGHYRVTGSRDGFNKEVREGIELAVGQEAIVDLSMTVGTVAQTVTVTGGAPLVESTTASLGSLVDDQTIRDLPLNGRSYDQLALIQPGVNLTSPGPASGIAYTFGTGARFSVGGQLPNSNSFLLDGTNINDQANGTPGGAAGTNLGVDTILEFKIFTNLYKAEFGHSTGSVITSVTRSGTNSYHGTAFEYTRNSVLDAKNFFDKGDSPPPFRRNQFGGVFGGPIKKDKLFFFGGYEGLRQGQGTTLIAIVPTTNARQGILPCNVVTPVPSGCVAGNIFNVTVPVNPIVVPYLNLYPDPNGLDLGSGEAQYISSPDIVTNEDNGMARVDYQLNDKNSLFVRYVFDQDNLNAPQKLPDQLIVTGSRRQYFTVQLSTLLGPTMLNNVRFAYNRTHSVQNFLILPPAPPSFIPGQELGGLTVGGLLTTQNPINPLGVLNGSGPSLWAWCIFEYGDDFSYTKGKHSLKTGVDIQRLQDNTLFNQQLLGNYTFATYQSLLAGKPQTFGAGYPVGEPAYWRIRQLLYAVYVQDDFKVNSRLTLNLGLRWEAPTDPGDTDKKSAIIPSYAATNTALSRTFITIGKNNFEPRFGLAWQLDASGKTVLRLGAGIYHDQILPWAFSQQTRTPPFFGLFLLTTTASPAFQVPFPNAASLLTGTPKPGTLGLNMMAPFDKTPADYQYNLSIQREIARNTMIQVAYVGNRANHIIISNEEDTPIPTIMPNGMPFYALNAPRRNTAWSGEKILSASGNSVYNSGTISLRHQSTHGFDGQVFYTYSKASDEGTSISGSESARSPTGIMYPDHPGLDWSLSDFNVTNSLGANFTYQLPFHVESKALGAIVNDWQFNGIFTFKSGQPFTVTDPTNISRNKATNGLADRPNLNPGFSSNPNHGISAGCTGLAAGTRVGTVAHWYDPCAFSLEAAGTYGDLRRNTVIGPGIQEVDIAIAKTFPIHEQINMTFRAEAFNVLNHANFGLPGTVALTAAGAASATAGNITYTTTSSRQIQFGLRLNF